MTSEDHKNISKEDRSLLKKCLQHHPKKMDFCKLSYSELIHLFQKIAKKTMNEEKLIPIIMIGHSKDFFDEKPLDRFLSFLCKKYKGKIQFSTLSEVVNNIINHKL